MVWRSKRLAIVVTVLVACGGDDGTNGDDTSGTDGSSSGSTTMVAPTTDPDSAGSSGVDPTITTDPESSDSADTGPPVNVCEPAEADSECYACQKENCCDAMTMCADADPNCACVLDCLGQSDDPGPTEANMCATDCDAEYVQLVPSLMLLTTCRMDMCGGNDGCGGG